MGDAGIYIDSCFRLLERRLISAAALREIVPMQISAASRVACIPCLVNGWRAAKVP